MLSAEDFIETDIFDVGCGARMTVLGARIVARFTKMEAQEAKGFIKLGQAPCWDRVAAECLNWAGVMISECFGEATKYMLGIMPGAD